MLQAFGFTERQARFLVLVLEHAGVCLPRQYRAFSGIAHGRHTHRFFEKLIRGGYATTDLAAPAHAGRVYHLQYKPWYRLLGEPDHRHRRPMSVGRAVERLMVLELHTRYRRLLGKAQLKPQVITAVGRELLGFVWAIGVWVERHPSAPLPLAAQAADGSRP